MYLPVTLGIVIGIERRIHFARNVHLALSVSSGIGYGKMILAYVIALRSVEHYVETSCRERFGVELVEHHHKTRRVEKPYLRFAEVAYVETEEIVTQSVKFGTQRSNIRGYVIVHGTFQPVEVYVPYGDGIGIFVDIEPRDVV